MASKAVWVERLRRLMSGGNITSDQKFRYEDVAFALSDAIAKAIEISMFEVKGMEGVWQIDGGWCKKYTNVPASWDGRINKPYADLPVKPLLLIRDSGVQLVRLVKSGDTLVRVGNDHDATFFGLEALRITRRNTYRVEGNRIIMDIAKEQLPQVLDMLIVASPWELDKEDEISIPVGKEALVTELVLKSFGITRAEDPINDNVNGNT